MYFKKNVGGGAASAFPTDQALEASAPSSRLLLVLERACESISSTIVAFWFKAITLRNNQSTVQSCISRKATNHYSPGDASIASNWTSAVCDVYPPTVIIDKHGASDNDYIG